MRPGGACSHGETVCCLLKTLELLVNPQLDTSVAIVIVQITDQGCREYIGADASVVDNHRDLLAGVSQRCGKLGSNESSADDDKLIDPVCQLTKSLIVMKGTKVDGLFSAIRQSPGPAARGNQQLVEVVGVSMIIHRCFRLQIQPAHRPAELQIYVEFGKVDPYLVDRFIVPETLGQWRSLIRRIDFATHHENRARLVDIPDAFNGGRRSHSTANNQIVHSFHAAAPFQKARFRTAKPGLSTTIILLLISSLSSCFSTYLTLSVQ